MSEFGTIEDNVRELADHGIVTEKEAGLLILLLGELDWVQGSYSFFEASDLAEAMDVPVQTINNLIHSLFDKEYVYTFDWDEIITIHLSKKGWALHPNVRESNARKNEET
jgi:DNA-binding MarR family transcriptional regulator